MWGLYEADSPASCDIARFSEAVKRVGEEDEKEKVVQEKAEEEEILLCF